jgi:hypothetical protein
VAILIAAVVVSASALSYASFEGTVTRTTTSTIVVTTATSSGGPSTGASTIYIWYLGSPTNLTQAEQSANYTLVTPSFLPPSTYLTGVRSAEGGNLVVLGYTVEGVAPILNNSGGWSMIVCQQSYSTDPIETTTMTSVESAVTTVVGYANGTQVTTMGSQSTVVYYPPPTITLDGQTATYSVLTATSPAFLSWWHAGIYYQIFGNLSLQELEQVADSMISSQT